MASTSSNNSTHASQQSSHSSTYENTKHAINECIKQLNEFTNSVNEVCNRANLFVHSLQALENVAAPEVVGSSTNYKTPKKIFDSTGHLCEIFHTLSEIMLSYSMKIKDEAIDEFDNFIMQVICPNRDELKGVHEHNKNIIGEFRDGFFSIMNHFFVVVAELMEKFLICGDCLTPIGFPHAPTCSNVSNGNNELNFVWKKNKVDDKYITYGMQFSFNELIIPGNRKDILTMIGSACVKQHCKNISRGEKVSFPPATKSWPSRWIRSSDKTRNVGNKLRHNQAVCRVGNSKFTYPVHIAHPPIFNPSVWTPSSKDDNQLQPNYDVVSFSYQPGCQ